MNRGRRWRQPGQFDLRVMLAGLFAMSMFASGGCGKSSGLVPVGGTVLVKGEPADGAVILFHPEGNPGGITASATADEEGKYSLSSGLEKGVAPGSYNVTVIWPDPSQKSDTPKMMVGSSVDIPDLLKGRYANPKTSVLKATVEAGTTEVPPFELEIP
jgi:hypothetical protein